MSSKGEKSTVHPDRVLAEEFFEKASHDLTNADEVELGAPEERGSLVRAQVHLLTAIYHELRYGNDSTAAHTAALDDVAGTMFDLTQALRRLEDFR